MHIYIYIVYIFVFTYIYIYLYMYIYICVYVYIYIYIFVYVYIDMFYIYIYMHCYCKYAALCRHGLPLIRHTPRDDFQSRIVPTDCLEYLVWVYELHGLTWLVLYPNIAGRSVVLTIPKWLWFFLGGRVNQQPAGFPMCKYRNKIMYIIIHSNIVVDIIHIIHTVTYSEQQNSTCDWSFLSARPIAARIRSWRRPRPPWRRDLIRGFADHGTFMGISWGYDGFIMGIIMWNLQFTLHSMLRRIMDLLISYDQYVIYVYIYIYISSL